MSLSNTHLLPIVLVRYVGVYFIVGFVATLGLVSTDNFSLTKQVCRRKICSCKFNTVAVFHCQISVTKMSALNNINNLCCV